MDGNRNELNTWLTSNDKYPWMLRYAPKTSWMTPLQYSAHESCPWWLPSSSMPFALTGLLNWINFLKKSLKFSDEMFRSFILMLFNRRKCVAFSFSIIFAAFALVTLVILQIFCLSRHVGVWCCALSLCVCVWVGHSHNCLVFVVNWFVVVLWPQ